MYESNVEKHRTSHKQHASAQHLYSDNYLEDNMYVLIEHVVNVLDRLLELYDSHMDSTPGKTWITTRVPG
jgi:hypothetical protein